MCVGGGKAFSEPERCYSNEVIIIAHAQPQAFLLSNDLQSSFFFHVILNGHSSRSSVKRCIPLARN